MKLEILLRDPSLLQKPFTPGRAVSPGSGFEFGAPSYNQRQLTPKLKYNWRGISQLTEKQKPEPNPSDRLWIELVNEDIVGLYNDGQLRQNDLFQGHFEQATENEEVTLKPYNPLKIADDSDDGNAEEIPGEQTTIIDEVNKTVSVKNS